MRRWKRWSRLWKAEWHRKWGSKKEQRGHTGGNSNIPHKPFLPSKHLKMYIYYLRIFLLFLPKPCGKLYFWTFVFFQPRIKPQWWLWTDLHLHRAFLVVLTTKCLPQYDWKHFLSWNILNLTQLTQLIKILHRNTIQYKLYTYTIKCMNVQEAIYA